MCMTVKHLKSWMKQLFKITTGSSISSLARLQFVSQNPLSCTGKQATTKNSIPFKVEERFRDTVSMSDVCKII